jgi:hypothetical protein
MRAFAKGASFLTDRIQITVSMIVLADVLLQRHISVGALSGSCGIAAG